MRIAPALPSVGGPGKAITRCVSGFTSLPPLAGAYDTAWAAETAWVPRTSAATSINVVRTAHLTVGSEPDRIQIGGGRSIGTMKIATGRQQ